MSEHDEFADTIEEFFDDLEIDDEVKETLKKNILFKLESYISTAQLKERLAILYQYESNYLSLIKDYKEEIKFAGTLQEDLRKERAKFFSVTLKEVSSSLKDSQVESDVASLWIKELVNSYTKSLDVSAGLVEERTFDTIGKIRNQAKAQLSTAANNVRKNEKEQND